MRVLLLSPFSRVDVDDLLDFSQFREGPLQREFHSRSRESSHHHCSEQEGDAAIESVYLDLGICPMLKRPPGSQRTILHFFEDIFDDVLTSVGMDNPCVVPVVACGDNNRLSQIRVGQLLKRLYI